MRDRKTSPHTSLPHPAWWGRGEREALEQTTMKQTTTSLFILLSLLFTVLSSHAQDTIQSHSAEQHQIGDTLLHTKVRITGYRVQIYYGGNDRNAKNEAIRRANRASVWFDQHKVYTFFQSPHWKCQVGNFRTRGEAEQLLNEMRENGRFPGAVIVRTRVTMSRHDYEASLSKDTLTKHHPAAIDTITRQ